MSASFHHWIVPLYELNEAARAWLKNPVKQRRTKSHTLIGIRAWQVRRAGRARVRGQRRLERRCERQQVRRRLGRSLQRTRTRTAAHRRRRRVAR